MKEVSDIEYTKFHINSNEAESLTDIADQFEYWSKYYRLLESKGVSLGSHRDGPWFELVFPSLELYQETYGEDSIPDSMEFDDE